MRSSTIVAAAVGMALLLSPAATVAAPAAPATNQTAPSAWMALSMLNSSGTVGLGDVAVQPSENAPPPDRYNVGGVPTPVIAFWVLTVAAMVYIATRHSSGSLHIVANSPG